jgi:hypothetical protein
VGNNTVVIAATDQVRTSEMICTIKVLNSTVGSKPSGGSNETGGGDSGTANQGVDTGTDDETAENQENPPENELFNDLKGYERASVFTDKTRGYDGYRQTCSGCFRV